VLHLLDVEDSTVPAAQLTKALDSVESWMVRRMLVRATTKNYNKVVAELITTLRTSDRDHSGDIVQTFLQSQRADSQYWPDDEEVRTTLKDLPVYRRIGRARLRMVMEALEDHMRGWKHGKAGLGGERVARDTYSIEHVMPVKWSTHWPPAAGTAAEIERDHLVHTLGNLTLLTKPLNSKVSNGPWSGDGGKWQALQEHDVLVLNRTLGKSVADAWTHKGIRDRTDQMIEAILEIWQVPEGHRSGLGHKTAKVHRKMDLADLINAGLLSVGMTLYPGQKKFDGRTAMLLADGRVDVEGTT